MAKKKLKFDFKRTPPKPKIAEFKSGFQWEQIAPGQIDIFTGGIFPPDITHRLMLSFNYRVTCGEEDIKEDEFDYSTIHQMEHVFITGPSADFKNPMHTQSSPDGKHHTVYVKPLWPKLNWG